MSDLISRADVEQTVEDNILCYTHSDRPIDQDPDTECHMAIRTALRMLRKDLRKLPSAQPGYEDAVSRKAAIDALPYLLDYEGFKGESGYVSKNLVRTMLKELPSVTPKQPGWIPCSKKLPELNRSVLVQLSDDFVDQIQIMTFNISKCEGDFFYFWKTKEMGIDFDMDDVVAWMPLPKLWEWEGLDG